MATRYYLCTVSGIGTINDPFRPRLADLLAGGNWSGIDGRADSTVAAGRMLAWADVDDATHATVNADPGITYCPFEDAAGNVLGLDDTLAQITAAKRTQIANFLEAQHIPTDDLTGTDTIRTLLKRVVKRWVGLRQLFGADDWTEGLDTLVSAVPAAKRNRINNRLTALGFDTSVIQGTDTIRQALKKLMAQAVRYLQTNWD